MTLIFTGFTAEFFACRTQSTGEWPIFLKNNLQPLDPEIHYGITDRDFMDVHAVQLDILAGKLHQA